MVRKLSFSYVEPKRKRNIEYWLKHKSTIIRELLFLFLSFPDSRRYIMYIYRRQAINRFSQRVGLGNSYCNFLAICRYFFQIKTFSVVDKIFLKSLITVPLFSLCYYLTNSHCIGKYHTAWNRPHILRLNPILPKKGNEPTPFYNIDYWGSYRLFLLSKKLQLIKIQKNIYIVSP
jgi:hypothetical protein